MRKESKFKVGKFLSDILRFFLESLNLILIIISYTLLFKNKDSIPNLILMLLTMLKNR